MLCCEVIVRCLRCAWRWHGHWTHVQLMDLNHHRPAPSCTVLNRPAPTCTDLAANNHVIVGSGPALALPGPASEDSIGGASTEGHRLLASKQSISVQMSGEDGCLQKLYSCRICNAIRKSWSKLLIFVFVSFLVSTCKILFTNKQRATDGKHISLVLITNILQQHCHERPKGGGGGGARVGARHPGIKSLLIWEALSSPGSFFTMWGVFLHYLRCIFSLWGLYLGLPSPPPLYKFPVCAHEHWTLLQ